MELAGRARSESDSHQELKAQGSRPGACLRIATACATIASPRPTASTPSLVFAFTLTRLASSPTAPASDSRIAIDERAQLRRLELHGHINVSHLEAVLDGHCDG